MDLAFAVVAFVGFAVVEVGIGNWGWIVVVLILITGFLFRLRRHSESHLLHGPLNHIPSHSSSLIPFLILIPNISLDLRFLVLLPNLSNLLPLFHHILLLSVLSLLDGIDHLREDVPIRKKRVIHIQKYNYK